MTHLIDIAHIIFQQSVNMRELIRGFLITNMFVIAFASFIVIGNETFT